MKSIKYYIILLLGMFLFTFGNSFYSNSLKVNENNKEAAVDTSYKKEWLLKDTYDQNSSYEESFLSKSNALDMLNTTYSELQNIPNIEYYNLSLQSFVLTTEFNEDMHFIDGDENARNQKIDGKTLTPLYSIQVPENFYFNSHYDQAVIEGTGFSNEDFEKTSDDVIPVLACETYKDIYPLHTKLTNYYLCLKEIPCEIVGYFKTGTQLDICGGLQDLDTYLMMPSIKPIANDQSYFQKILLSIYCNGYLHYENEKEYNLIRKNLINIKRNTTYQYVIPKQMLSYPYGLPTIPCLIIMITGVTIIALSIYSCSIKKSLFSNIHGRKQIVSICLYYILLIALTSQIAEYSNFFLFHKYYTIMKVEYTKRLLFFGGAIIFFSMYQIVSQRRGSNNEF